jgi:hypothetical protein
MHRVSSIERGDPIESLTRCDATPVRLELLSVRHGPFLNEADGRSGANPARKHLPVKRERRQLPLVLGMEVPYSVLAIEHPDHDAKKR